MTPTLISAWVGAHSANWSRRRLLRVDRDRMIGDRRFQTVGGKHRTWLNADLYRALFRR